MSQPLLVIDVSYMCHRAFHTTRSLSHKGIKTGVTFGFLKSIGILKDEFQTDRVVFCFDHFDSLRRKLYPDYKKRRRVERTNEELAAYQELNTQITLLRKQYLPKIGFKNIFWYSGYESDDIMAAIAKNEPSEVILITADSDLLQCLSETVSIYSPAAQKLHTWPSFYAKYGIVPTQWAMVKAIAGCKSDEVEGIKGVGEIGAVKFIKWKLPAKTKQYQAIMSRAGKAIVRRNRDLVQLPFKGCPVPKIVEDEIDAEGWRQVCGELGMRSLSGKLPVATRKAKQLGLKI